MPGRTSTALARSVLFAMLGASTCSPVHAADAYASLAGAREQVVRELARPVHACVKRVDTSHAAFHGCIDWHSSVHGTWALVAFESLTRDARFAATVDSILADGKLSRERQALQRNREFEMPYGRAWFLRLVREFELLRPGDERLRGFGDMIAASLLEHYASNDADPAARDYDSASWALINLHEYALHRSDLSTKAAVEQMVRERFVPGDGECTARTRPETGFMAVCSNWAWLVSKVLPAGAFGRWVARFMPPASVPAPIARARGAHQNGLNFSRAWGLWHVYVATGNTDYRKLYAAHVQASYGRRESWDGDYHAVGHWVAQFGILAMQPLFARATRPGA
jgi:hypothetical protein